MGRRPENETPRPPFLHRVSARQWRSLSVALSVLLLVSGLSSILTIGHNARHPHNTALLIAALCLAVVALPFRQRHPVGTLVVVAAAVVTGTFLGQGLAGTPIVALPIYSVATLRGRRSSMVAALVVGAAFLAALGIAALIKPAGSSITSIDATDNLIAVAVAWFLGDSVRSRRAYVAGTALQAEQRQRLEVEQAQKSLAEERLHIARELHDIVAHSLSVIAIQSGVGGHVLDEQPEEARKALAAIETTSRSALNDLRRVLGVLRSDEPDEPSLVPAPGMAELDGLLDQCRAAGLNVSFHQHGRSVPVSPSLDLSLYRIIQEALTNVTKHAGTARASVDITYEDDAVIVSVVDEGALHRNGAVLVPDDGGSAESHHGIVGMRERTAMFGGSLSAAPRAGGGFEVRARLPITAGES
jgi:signal transduction histidine kinase